MDTRLIKKVQNKTSYVEYGAPAINWKLVTFINGTQAAYIDNTIMPLELAVKLHEVSDKVYTMTSILHRKAEFSTLN